ncbi:MAG TPA: HK97 gp10 family phage protein [Naasia sp.]|jgi:hypothetical protein
MKFNNAFFEELGSSPAVEALVVDAANRVAARAKADAPVDTGEYVGKIKVQVHRRRKLRTVALVVATDDKSMIIESRHGTLARALQAVKRGR